MTIINPGLHQLPNHVVRNSCLPPTACKYHPCGHFTFSLLVGGTPLQIPTLLLFNLFSSHLTPTISSWNFHSAQNWRTPLQHITIQHLLDFTKLVNYGPKRFIWDPENSAKFSKVNGYGRGESNNWFANDAL